MKPILFNTEMVRAILDGRKSVTRRVVKPPALDKMVLDNHGNCVGSFEYQHGSDVYPTVDDSPYCFGDILYVRETFCGWYLPGGKWKYCYKATDLNGNKAPTGPEYGDEWEVRPWHPSIHMPKEAARLFLRVTGVRVERLQDITEEQAINEGCNGVFTGTGEAMGSGWDTTPCEEFSVLWNSTIKMDKLPVHGWDANPWVWVIEFERYEKPKEDKL